MAIADPERGALSIFQELCVNHNVTLKDVEYTLERNKQYISYWTWHRYNTAAAALAALKIDKKVDAPARSTEDESCAHSLLSLVHLDATKTGEAKQDSAGMQLASPEATLQEVVTESMPAIPCVGQPNTDLTSITIPEQGGLQTQAAPYGKREWGGASADENRDVATKLPGTAISSEGDEQDEEDLLFRGIDFSGEEPGWHLDAEGIDEGSSFNLGVSEEGETDNGSDEVDVEEAAKATDGKVPKSKKVSAKTKQAVVDMAIANPTLGSRKLSKNLEAQGINFSEKTIECILKDHGLNTFAQRVARAEAEGVDITQITLRKEAEQALVDMAIANPELGPRMLCQELIARGITLSVPTVREILLKHNLNNKHNRKAAAEGIVIEAAKPQKVEKWSEGAKQALRDAAIENPYFGYVELVSEVGKEGFILTKNQVKGGLDRLGLTMKKRGELKTKKEGAAFGANDAEGLEDSMDFEAYRGASPKAKTTGSKRKRGDSRDGAKAGNVENLSAQDLPWLQDDIKEVNGIASYLEEGDMEEVNAMELGSTAEKTDDDSAFNMDVSEEDEDQAKSIQPPMAHAAASSLTEEEMNLGEDCDDIISAISEVLGIMPLLDEEFGEATQDGSAVSMPATPHFQENPQLPYKVMSAVASPSVSEVAVQGKGSKGEALDEGEYPESITSTSTENVAAAASCFLESHSNGVVPSLYTVTLGDEYEDHDLF